MLIRDPAVIAQAVRDLRKDDETRDTYMLGNRVSKVADLFTVRDAFLAECDETPITAETLAAEGYLMTGPNRWKGDAVVIRKDAESFWEAAGNDGGLYHPQTVGRLRTVCRWVRENNSR